MSKFPVISFVPIFFLLVFYLFEYPNFEWLFWIIYIWLFFLMTFIVGLAIGAISFPNKIVIDFKVLSLRLRKFTNNFNRVNKTLAVKIGFDDLWLEIYHRTRTSTMETQYVAQKGGNSNRMSVFSHVIPKASK